MSSRVFLKKILACTKSQENEKKEINVTWKNTKDSIIMILINQQSEYKNISTSKWIIEAIYRINFSHIASRP